MISPGLKRLFVHNDSRKRLRLPVHSNLRKSNSVCSKIIWKVSYHSILFLQIFYLHSPEEEEQHTGRTYTQRASPYRLRDHLVSYVDNNNEDLWNDTFMFPMPQLSIKFFYVPLYFAFCALF